MPSYQFHATVVLVRGTSEVASWPLEGIGSGPDLGVVDELARLQLAARRAGYSIRLQGTCPQLTELLGLVGLADVVGGARSGGPVERGSVVQMGGEPEGGE